MHVDVAYGFAEARIHWVSASKLIAPKMASGDILVAATIRLEKSSNRAYIPFGLLTCVGLAKSLLGISDVWVQTPYALFRKLQKMGADVTWAEQ